MPRPNKPWFRKSKNAWYVKIDGKQIHLGVNGKQNRKLALEAFAKKLLECPDEKGTTSHIRRKETVEEIIKGFLEEIESRCKPITIRTYRRFLVPFAQRCGKILSEKLTANQVEIYATKPTWSDTTRNGFLTAIATAFRSSGINLSLTIPPKASRGVETIISSETFQRIVSVATGDFAPLLRFLWETGCRPSEAFAIRLEEVDWSIGIVVLKDHKTVSKTRKARTIYLSSEALSILTSQGGSYGGGVAFRMSNGEPWTLNAAVTRIWRLNKKCETSITLYGFRHSFATEALAKGIPETHVSELLGHSGTTMLHKHYSHLSTKAKLLREAVESIRS